MNRAIWIILMACWFALWGLLAITNLKFEAQNLLMGVLALGVAVFVILQK